MKESEVTRLLEQYKAEAGTCSKLPTSRARRKLAWAPIAACATVVLALGITLWPRNAAAEAIKRVGLALKDVRTMHVTSYIKGFGKWRLSEDRVYKDGMWRWDVRQGPLKGFGIRAHGEQLTSLNSRPYAIVKPISDEELTLDLQELLKSDSNILEFTLNTLRRPEAEETDTTEVRGHAPVKGRATYLIVFDQPSSYYHAEVLVDSATHLPLRLEFRTANALRYEFRKDFEYGVPVSDALFSMNVDKPVLDVREERKKLERDWAPALASVGAAKVRSASVTPDGTIWIASTWIEDNAVAGLPNRLKTDTGADYARIPYDYRPSGTFLRRERDKVEGEDVLLTCFVPLKTPMVLPRQIFLSFSLRAPGHVPGMFSRAPKAFGPEIKVKLEREPDSLPGYFATLDLDHSRWMIAQKIKSTKAEELERRLRWREAALAWEDTAREVERTSKWSWNELDKAAQCYARAGDRLSAARVERLARAADYRPLLGLPTD